MKKTILLTISGLAISTAGSYAATIANAGATTPSADALITQAVDNSFTRMGTAHGARGQSFTAPVGFDWSITAFSFKIDNSASGSSGLPDNPDPISLQIFTVVGSTFTAVGSAQTASLEVAAANSDWITFTLDSAFTLTSGNEAAMNVTSTTNNRIQLGISNTGGYDGGQIISSSGFPSGQAGNDLTFVLHGTATPVPEPSSTALLGLGGLALILRRRK